MISRTQCLLRDLTESDLSQVLTWRNSERVRQAMFSDNIISWEEHVAWFKKIKASSNMHALIFQLQDVPLGVVTLTNIDYRNKRCNWGFYIGDEHAPAGSGTAMGFLALEYIFEQFNLHKLCAEVLKTNFISQKYHLKLGFDLEGCLRQHIYRNGSYEDVLCYAHFNIKWKKIKEELYQISFKE